MKIATEIDQTVKAEADFRNSDMYLAVMIKTQERFLQLTKRCKFADPRPDGDENDEGNISLVNEVTAEGLPRLRQKIPIFAKIIEATSRLRNDEKRRLIDKGFDMDKFELDDLLASDQHNFINEHLGPVRYEHYDP